MPRIQPGRASPLESTYALTVRPFTAIWACTSPLCGKRIELARLTNLNKATVTNLVGELIKNGFVREIGEITNNRAGRREVLLDLDPQRGCFLSAEIGVGFISIICTNFAAQIIWKERQIIDDLQPESLLMETVKLLKKGREIGEEKCGRDRQVASLQRRRRQASKPRLRLAKPHFGRASRSIPSLRRLDRLAVCLTRRLL